MIDCSFRIQQSITNRFRLDENLCPLALGEGDVEQDVHNAAIILEVILGLEKRSRRRVRQAHKHSRTIPGAPCPTVKVGRQL